MMQWHVIIAVDPQTNADLVQWATQNGGEAVSQVEFVDSAAQLPVIMARSKNDPMALLLSTLCPDLTEWAETIAAVLSQRQQPSRTVLMAEGTPDGAPGELGSLAASDLVQRAQVMKGQAVGTDEIQFDYEAMGQDLWGTALAPPTPSPARRIGPPLAESPVPPPQKPEKPRGLRALWASRARSENRGTPAVVTAEDVLDDFDAPPEPMARIVLPPSKLIVVVGGKGGVGKTTVSAALMAAAARAYGSALGVDFDYLKPNLSLHFWDIAEPLPDLNVLFDEIDVTRQQPGGSNPDAERRMIAQWMTQLRPPVKGLLVVPGPHRRLKTVLPPEHVPAMILDWAMSQDEPIVVCDTDPALDEAAEVALTTAGNDGTIILVTTPERDAVAETDRVRRQIVDGMGIIAERLVLIINHRGSPRSDLTTAEILSTHLPGIELLAELPWVPKAAQGALANHHPIQNWPRRVRWDTILAAATGRTPERRRGHRR